ncbi:DUF3164 family protein [Caballeronia sp. LZ001]|uniref:DUF3164 family protein n=1 Tax=Caballeronia sp. LZ001 TaxID=3038553 RepID=UPI0028663D20|nr:DUF3164 family protein [Caballeronia sp. LZ001]MDR5803424.1 DUF3164 family protein [Caballeronia sp. LZ001]
MTTQTTIPGFVRDARGRYVPAASVKPVDQLRDQAVMKLVDEAKQLHERLRDFKARAFSDVEAFVQVSSEQYGVRIRTIKGNISLITFDGRFRVVRQIAEHIQFGEQLQAAKELIDECIREWTEGSSDEIKALINEAFHVDRQGNVNTARVLGLRRLAIAHPKWDTAMHAISDSIRVTGTKPYIRFYARDETTGAWRNITLDFAAA